MAATNTYVLKGDDATNSQFVNIVANISQAMQKMTTVFVQQMQVIENTLELLVTSGDDVRVKNNFSDSLKLPSLSSKDMHPCCDKVLSKLSILEGVVQKLCESFCTDVKTSEKSQSKSTKLNTPVVLLTDTNCRKPTTVQAQVSLDSSFQIITLNAEDDYPGGSWLGDEDIAEARVRVPISPGTLQQINTACQTPEKMAITLLDYLFTRETLAVSNLSGKGKHGKKQLDPLLIYAIRCHLIYKFRITEKDWCRIKQNMDSKCRTTWRKKLRGQPLGGRSKLPIQPSFSSTMVNCNSDSSCGNLSGKSEPEILMRIDSDTISLASPFIREDYEDVGTGLLRTVDGEYKVIRASREQLEKIQNAHSVLEVFEANDQGPLLSEEDTRMTLDDPSETTLVTDDDQEVSVLTVEGDLNIDCN